MAPIRSRGDRADRIDSPTLGPTPWTVVSRRNQSRSAVSMNPNSWIASSRTWVSTSNFADRGRLRQRGQRPRRGVHEIPHARHVDDAAPVFQGGNEAGELGDHCAGATPSWLRRDGQLYTARPFEAFPFS